MEVSASISYIINPEASTSVCGSSSQDANACFEVYGITKGNIAVYAFWQRWKLSKVNNSDINCNNNSKKFSFPLPPIHSFILMSLIQRSWGKKNKFHRLSRTWSLANTRKKLFGRCYACNCYGRHFLNVLCKGRQVRASYCSCSTRMSK